MSHVYNLVDLQLTRPSMVTIGVFDSVHRGHQTLIRQLVDAAHGQGMLAVAITFFPHPDVVLGNAPERYYLTTPEQRAALLLDLGLDYVVTHPFDDAIRQVRASDFVDLLRQHLDMRHLQVGADFALGHQREGNIDFLRAAGAEKGFSVEAVALLEAPDGAVICSAAIRDFLRTGQIEQANDWLGRAYTVDGTVVHGEQRGRGIGFPTANLQIWDEQIIPANGVYAGWAWLNDAPFMAVTNVGVRPTFAGDDVTIEAYLLDFDRDIYGQRMRLSFDQRLRGEQHFDGIESLVTQIRSDCEAARAFLESHAPHLS